MKRFAKHFLLGLVAIAVVTELVFLVDWAVFDVRVSHGSAYGTVEVNQFLATSLKGSKTEYDLTGTVQQKCTHSIFPHNSYPACWWVERRKAQWQ